MASSNGAFADGEWIPRVNYSMYWERKEKFSLHEDTYDHWIMLVVSDGSFYYEILEHKGTAGRGDIVFCPPRTPFRRVVITPLTFLLVRLIWENKHGQPIAAPETVPIGKISIGNTARLSSTCEQIRQAQTMEEPWRSQLKAHYVLDLWYLYGKETGIFGGVGGHAIDLSGRDTADPLMQTAASLIERSAFQPFTLKSVAQSLHLSPAQFTKKFKSTFGMTPIRHITALRLDKAKSLLLETKMTLDQISECCGYPNGFYLNRVFMKHMKMTPSQFRSLHLL